jgi:hypothetical protein
VGLFSKSLSDLWKNHKIFLIFFGLIIVFLKFSDFFIDLLISSSRNISNNAKQEDLDLAKKQKDANSKANDLIDKSNNLEKNKKKAKEDWHKK